MRVFVFFFWILDFLSLSIHIEGRISAHKWLELFGWKIIGVSVFHVGYATKNAIHSNAKCVYALLQAVKYDEQVT